MQRIDIYDVPEEGKKCFGRAIWTFIFIERRGLILGRYAQEERPTLRHKFKVTACYDRLSSRRGFEECRRISEDDAPLPQWVVDRARQMFMDDLRIRKWSDE